MDDTTHETVTERSRSTLVWPVMGLVAGLPVLYALSFGPVLRLCASVSPYRIPVWVGVIYAPLAWLHEHTPLRGPLDWYLGLWGPF